MTDHSKNPLGRQTDAAAMLREAEREDRILSSARVEQRWLEDDDLPLEHVRAIYVAYEFARAHVDREAAMLHANEIYSVIKDLRIDIGLTLVRDLCNVFDRERGTP